MFEFINTNKYFIQVAGSVEKHAAEELENMGATILKELPRGLRIQCEPKTLYEIIYTSRLSQRLLAPLISFQCHSEKYLYSQAKNIDWTSLFPLQDNFSIIANVSRCKFNNSLYAGQLLKDAICDQFREKYGERPNFKTKEADINFNLHISDNWATIYLDTAGISMHKRGYKRISYIAPLQETLAATVIKLSEWDRNKPLHDIMCGSGTILAEALMLKCNIPAGYLRDEKPLRYLPNFDEALWKEVKDKANAKIIPIDHGLIKGSDENKDAIEITRKNLEALPYGDRVELHIAKFQDLPKESNKIIIANPPYGIRLGEQKAISILYNQLGDFLKQKCPQSEAYILCGSKELISAIRLRAHWKKNLKNGNLSVVLAKILIK
ncbi:MAG TPA: THUMP domain-containing protein [Candidatus Cloacimonadota bacterium]|nr:THUMP domain-containing protein [Candidatus Cloacimonadota bacterium]